MSTSLVQISDIHFGREDAVAIARTADFIDQTKPDAIIVCGDLTQRGKTEEFAAATQWLEKRAGPKLVVPGNHDTPLLDIATRVIDPFGRYEDHFGPLDPILEVSGWTIKGFNTARGWQVRGNWAEGSVDLDDLDSMFCAPAADILVCHHPFISLPNAALRTRTRRGRRAHNLVAANQPRLLLTGHVHTPSAVHRQTAHGGYLAVSAGTLSTRLRDEPPSFNLLHLDGDKLTIDVMALQGEELKPSRLGEWSLDALAGAQIAQV